MGSFRLKSVLLFIGSLLFTQEVGMAVAFSNPSVPTEIELESENETKKEDLEDFIANSLKPKSNRSSKPYKYHLPNTLSRVTNRLACSFYQKNSRTIVYHSLLI